MIIVCQHCSSRFLIEDQKAAGRRTTNCPKCTKEIEITSSSPASEKSALTLGGSPATESKRARPAPLFEMEAAARNNPSAPVNAEKLMQMLAGAFGENGESKSSTAVDQPSWKNRKVLVCANEEYREKVARMLAKNECQVFLAVDTEQAVERMRENRLDVVLLDPQFDAAEQGAAFVAREVNVLRPTQRRRLFFVLLSPSLRTLDAHGAFLNNVNAIVNLKDVDDLVPILGRALRGFNELYDDFNNALKLASI